MQTPGNHHEADGEGRVLAGRYRVTRQLGRGGMGVVWQAVDEVLGREVAVKELRTFTDAARSELADLRTRMQREARAAARVRHPGVIAVHDVADHEGRPIIVMELVEGPSLDDVLNESGPMEPSRAAAVGTKVLDALAAAHRVGVLHRDVKPGNILLERGGRVVLTDFGIAAMENPDDGATTRLTGSGELVGSLDYLAPERARGGEPGPPSDVWALGATIYAAVEGASPFRRTSAWSTLTAIVTESLPEPQRAGALGRVLPELMHKEPGQRADAEHAAELLAAVAAEEPRPESSGTTQLRPVGEPADGTSGGPGQSAEPTARSVGHASDRSAPSEGASELPAAPTRGAGTANHRPEPQDAETDRHTVRTTSRPARGKRRVALTAAALAVALAGTGTGYALFAGGGDDGSDTSTADSRGAEGGSGGGGSGGSAQGASPDGSASGSADSDGEGDGGSGADAAPLRCEPLTKKKFTCEVWREAKSYDAEHNEVGSLNIGKNYFYCQQKFPHRETFDRWSNVWWAKTDDDRGNSGVFISVVYLKGGHNDKPVPGLPTC